VFAEPERTRYDLNFHLFGFPVRIHPWFWLIVILFGANELDAGNHLAFLTWVVVVFVSLLVHELGHAAAFRRFGSDAHIVLHAFGGLAVPWTAVRGRGRRILIALAGPAAGFLLFGIVYGSNVFLHWAKEGPPAVSWLYIQLVFVNLWWGLVNLLPVWPLDGGQVCEEVCTAVRPRNGRRVALQISVTVAGAFCLYSLLCMVNDRQGGFDWIDAIPTEFHGSMWTAILFGMLAAQSYQALQRVKWTDSHWQQ
jgi:stage IV sporulation protein FB